MKISLTAEKKPLLPKVLLIMKITTVLMLLFALQVSAKGFGQKKLNLQFKKTEIASILSTIEKGSDYRFLYDNNLKGIRLKVTFQIKDADLKQVLDNLFENTGLAYQFMDNNLVVIKEAGAPDIDPKQVITGKVTGDNSVPLAGVSVQVKGTNKGTVTNDQGAYTINANASDVLIFSYVGYESQELAIGGKSELNVALALSKKELEQVVVIGYGVANRRDLTGSIVKIDGKEVADKPNTNPVASLQGKVAGLSIVNNGNPGQAPDIRIRGTASIGQVAPLYVVDGIFNDNIDYLNPNDIESIEILKDPSSLAIFGVRGATGVILITTKKAKAGQTLVNLNTTYGIKNLVNKIKMANASQFNTLFAEENANNNVATPNYSALTANTDWIDAVTRTAHFNTDNLSISSSTDKNRFNMNLGYQYDEGIIQHQQLSKMLASISDEFKINNWLRVGGNISVSRQHDPYDVTGSGTDVLNSARKVMPQISAVPQMFTVANPYGSGTIKTLLYQGTAPALQNSGVEDPLIQLNNEWNTWVSYEWRTVGSIFAELNLYKGLTFKATFYGDINNQDARKYTPLYDKFLVDPASGALSTTAATQTTALVQYENVTRKFQQDEVLTYIKKFGSHNLTATAGFTTYYQGYFGNQTTVQQGAAPAQPIPNDPRFWYVSNGYGVVNASPSATNSSQNEKTTVSALARVMYNYQYKYFLNASLRNDASSQIPAANRNQQFWAVGAAWDITKEDFMKNQNIFDFLKIKGSVGLLGNQTATDGNGNALPYPFYPLINQGQVAVFGNNIYTAATPQYVANPNLKWETVSAHEAGVELSTLKGRLHFEGAYFNNTTNNLMTYVSRASLGEPDELTNGGSIRNWGEELSASWNQNFTKDLTLNISGNITFLQNKVLSMAKDLPNGVIDVTSQNNGEAISETKAGMPIGYFKGYEVTGVYQSYADILKNPSEASLGAARPGDLKYKDINGDGQISSADRTEIGNPTPKFTYGSAIMLTYKGLNLGIDVGGVYGNQVFRTWGALESPFQRVNYAAFELGRWHGPGTSNWVPILSQADRINYVGSTYSIEDGSYFRIRNIQLGYNVPQSLIGKAKLKSLRLFVNVQNPVTFKNNSGYTAEFGGTATQFGYDNGGGAIPAVTTFGLNVTF